MKRFQFKLQAVLTLRLRAEQEALANYAQAVQVKQAAAEKLAGTEVQLCDARRRWLNALADGCPAVRAAQMLEFSRWLEERKQQAEQTLRLAEVEVNQASQKMIQARQQREAVEKYLANQRDKYERELRDEERKTIDDLVQRSGANTLSASLVQDTGWN
jgi:flagellar export protein FliJ